MNRTELSRRYAFFIVGLFVNSLGISFITKADLGTSPISSIPYTLSIGFSPSLGLFTLYFSLLLIGIQLLILRKQFPKPFWLQLPVSLGFSLFIDLSMALLSFLHPQTYPVQFLFLLLGCLVLGIGVFMEMAANVVMLPGECTVKAISFTWHTDFGKTKIALDSTMAVSAALLGLLLYHSLAGVREGTFLSALLVGFLARKINLFFGEALQTRFASPGPLALFRRWSKQTKGSFHSLR
ncbi:MAG: DUF6198 family protein [Evtepia sp.]|uniref:YczE/YyaS/YitT family protein n=1 Tax=Evtepia sp. TaxID=2773933 RepID=UPI002A75E8E5|nr:DUF6198 family protein [Evtepia sp.]MDY3014701.1 DUF6198 family protein [Evtepia sp.]